MPGQRDPFLRGRGAPVTAPNASEHAMSIIAVTETYALKAADAAALLSSPPDGAVRYRQVQQWLQGGRARLVTITAGAAKSNTRALVESVDMVSAGTKFRAPQAPNEAAVALTMTPAQYGDRLEFQPFVSPDNGTFNLNISLDESQLLKQRPLRFGPQVAPVPASVVQKSQIMTSLVGRSGTPMLLGTLTPATASKAEDKEMEVAFGRVLIHREAPEQAAAPAGSPDYAEHLFTFYSLDRAQAREVLGGELKPGAVHAAVQGLVEKKQAQFEHALLVPSQTGVRAKSDENIVSAEPAALSVASDRDSQSPPAFSPVLAGKNLGLSIEVESALGSTDAPPRGGPMVADVNAIIQWRDDRGVWKPGAGAPPLFPEVTVQESRKIETSLYCYAGVQTFVGTLNPPRVTGVNDRKDNGRVWLVFLRTTPVKP